MMEFLKRIGSLALDIGAILSVGAFILLLLLL